MLAWDNEECRAWYTDFVCSSNRPVAWTRGEANHATCQYDASLWTVCNSDVHLLDGETGEVMETIGTSAGFVYGGAADADGNFWGLDTSFSQIFRVDAGTLDVEYWPLSTAGGYGITVDHLGRPWTCGGGGVRPLQPRLGDLGHRGPRKRDRRLHDRRRVDDLAQQTAAC